MSLQKKIPILFHTDSFAESRGLGWYQDSKRVSSSDARSFYLYWVACPWQSFLKLNGISLPIPALLLVPVDAAYCTLVIFVYIVSISTSAGGMLGYSAHSFGSSLTTFSDLPHQGQVIGLDLSKEMISNGIDESRVLFGLKNLKLNPLPDSWRTVTADKVRNS
ncbi:hypothetical protein Tco_0940592 [Tanacetum coccineum]|uniref:Uncharacterized protein n=1 Tax=Tanacetum coccineum TaxID=301880 RepID=A0ABQ5DQR4_9ASTR